MNERGIDFDKIELPWGDMGLCKTDIQNIIRLLEKGSELIDKYCQKPHELDKARRMRLMIKKLKNK